MGSRSCRCLLTIASLQHLFFQHLPDEAVRACLLPEEAPKDQHHEGQAEGQHLPPGPLLLPSQGMLHRPAGRVGFAGGKQNGAVSVFFFFALGRRLGPSPAPGRRMQASGRPARQPQRPDGPGRETAVSASPSAPALGPAESARSSPGRRHTQDTAQHDPGTALGAAARHAPITSVAQNRKPDAAPGLRSRLQNVGPTSATEMTRVLPAASFVAGPGSAGRGGMPGNVVLHRPEEKGAGRSPGSSAGMEAGGRGAAVVLGRAGLRAGSPAGRARRRSAPSPYTQCWSSPGTPPPRSLATPRFALPETFSHGRHLVSSFSVPH